jgi:Reverse transcriptase (RNA-dependent DNA polymerase)
LESVAESFPELSPFATSTMAEGTQLCFGSFTLRSEEGVQQGDPLGALYFCLAIQKLLISLQSDLVVAYLDDVTLGGNESTVERDFLRIETEFSKLGLMLNRLKCEVIRTETTRSQDQTTNRTLDSLPQTASTSALLLGAPLFAGEQLDSVLRHKREELETLASRLSLMPSHDSLFLLRNVLTAARMLYLLRTAPCTGSIELQAYDDLLRETISTTLNIDLSGDRWQQASLPVRWGGLGIRGVVLLAPSAYLASAASTTTLTQLLLPDHLRGKDDEGVVAALSAWTSATNGTPPSLPSSCIQRSWDDCCCRVVAEQLLRNAQDQVERARLLASAACGSGDWLNTLPLQAIGLKLDNASVRIAVGLRLGAPLVHPHVCVCGDHVSADGRHGLACRKSAGRQSRHSQINDILQRAFLAADVPATREPHGLCTQAGKRPDGVTSIPWQNGRCLSWDATCPDTYAPSHLLATSVAAGGAASAAETKKNAKYADIMHGIKFVPFAIETSGVWGSEAAALVRELGRRTSVIKGEPRSTSFLRQRVSLAIQRGNAYSILATLRTPPSDSDC